MSIKTLLFYFLFEWCHAVSIPIRWVWLCEKIIPEIVVCFFSLCLRRLDVITFKSIWPVFWVLLLSGTIVVLPCLILTQYFVCRYNISELSIIESTVFFILVWIWMIHLCHLIISFFNLLLCRILLAIQNSIIVHLGVESSSKSKLLAIKHSPLDCHGIWTDPCVFYTLFRYKL